MLVPSVMYIEEKFDVREKKKRNELSSVKMKCLQGMFRVTRTTVQVSRVRVHYEALDLVI